MSDLIEIPKWTQQNDVYPSWCDTYDTNGTRVRPHIRCNCGRHTNIDNHHIHADGRITASYYDNVVAGNGKIIGCGWHVFLKMIGWDGGEL